MLVAFGNTRDVLTTLADDAETDANQNKNNKFYINTNWTCHPECLTECGVTPSMGHHSLRKLRTCWQTYQHIHTLRRTDCQRRNSRQMGPLLRDHAVSPLFPFHDLWIFNCSFISFPRYFCLLNWFIPFTHDSFIVLLIFCTLQYTREYSDTLQFRVITEHESRIMSFPPIVQNKNMQKCSMDNSRLHIKGGGGGGGGSGWCRCDCVRLIRASTPPCCAGQLIRRADRWQEVCEAGWRQSYLAAEKDCSRPGFLTQWREG